MLRHGTGSDNNRDNNCKSYIDPHRNSADYTQLIKHLKKMVDKDMCSCRYRNSDLHNKTEH